jgi:uncharacterized cupin superfamily protein
MYICFDAPSESPFKAVPMDYALARLEDARWSPGPHPGLRMRDCLLEQASKGQMASRHFAAERAGSAERWPIGRRSFDFLFLLAGTLTIATATGEEITLGKGDSAIQDVLRQDRPVRWSADFEAVDIVAPAPGASVQPVELLDLPRKTSADLASLVSRDVPENYAAGKGPRRFMIYRDLHAMAQTDRRLHVHLVRAVEAPEGGTGWHVHSMSQLFYVARGWVDIAVDGVGVVHMVRGDAMCVANGMRHNVFRFSPDYDVLEMCLPGDYSTVPTPAPDGIELGAPARAP